MKSNSNQTEQTGTRTRIILYTIAVLISLAGLVAAIYLASMSDNPAGCAGSPGCVEVLGSRYAKIAGIPVALLGALGYFAVFTFATLAGFRYKHARGLFVLTVWLMFAMTLWLLYVQAFLLHVFCRYCLFSAAFVFLLAGLAVVSPRPVEDEEE